MTTRREKIGRYEVFYWEKQSPEGQSGWNVAAIDPRGGLGVPISKHTHKADAIAAAKRYDAGDKRRAS